MTELVRMGGDPLPFALVTTGDAHRLALTDHAIENLIHLDRLELEIPGGGVDGDGSLDRYQRRRTRLHLATLRIDQAAIDRRIERAAEALAPTGISQLAARLVPGRIAVSCRFVDGLAAADVTFRVHVAAAGATLRVTAGAVRVHGYVPTPSPLIADRVLVAVLGAGATGASHVPRVRGLCDVEIDVLDAALWRLLPPSGWRLPATGGVELVIARATPTAITLTYAPVGAALERGSNGHDPGVAEGELAAHALASAHDAMRSADELLRRGQLDDAMRGYRALLAAGGPDQPVLLERLLALTAARPTWFLDGVELARQALARWPDFLPARSALASIALARGDTREAARHLQTLAELAAAGDDHDGAALAALAGARLLRVIEPRSATRLYELAVEHRPKNNEAIDGLAERYADERRWLDLVRLLRDRAEMSPDRVRASALHLQLAELLADQLADPDAARGELERAAAVSPTDLDVLQATAAGLTRLAGADAPGAAIARAALAWRAVIRLAEERDETAAIANAWSALAGLPGTSDDAREDAWRHAVALVPTHPLAQLGLARLAAARGDHRAAVDAYDIGLGELKSTAGADDDVVARAEIGRAESLVALGDRDAAEVALRRASGARGETAALAHGMLAQLSLDDLAAGIDNVETTEPSAPVDRAISALVEIADGAFVDDGGRLYARAAELALARAELREKSGDRDGASADLERAHELAITHAPAVARRAARALLDHAGDDALVERRWIDAVLATRPPPDERAPLLVQRARLRLAEPASDPMASIADLHEALALPCDDDLRRTAYSLEAEILATTGDRRARAQALTARARLAQDAGDSAETETAAATAWLDADDPQAALPHGNRAMRAMGEVAVADATRRQLLITLGEAAWRQRAFNDVVVAYRQLFLDAELVGTTQRATFGYRLAVALDRVGQSAAAARTLGVILDDDAGAELRGQILRLRAELAERAGDLATAADALESFAAIDDPAVGSSPAARADALYRAGELHRRRESLDDAARCLEGCLDVVDHHLPALDSLELVERGRGDLERVAVILGRKIAASSRHPARQKSILARLAELWIELAKPELARAAYNRALEIDADFRPALRFLADDDGARGATVDAVTRYLRLAHRLAGDPGDAEAIAAERASALAALTDLLPKLPDAERAALEPEIARIGGELSATIALPSRRNIRDDEESTLAGRLDTAEATAIGLRAAAAVARTEGELGQALADLEAARTVAPGDPELLRELIDVARELDDHRAAAQHLDALIHALEGAGRTTRRAEVLLELADLCYDKLDDLPRARVAMRSAADAFGTGSRRETTLRLLAAEAAARRDWDVAASAYESIEMARRTPADIVQLGTVLHRAGRAADAFDLLADAERAGKLDDEGVLLRLTLETERDRKARRAEALEDRAARATADDAKARLVEALHLYRDALGDSGAVARVSAALAAVHDEVIEPLPPAVVETEAEPEAEPEPEPEQRSIELEADEPEESDETIVFDPDLPGFIAPPPGGNGHATDAVDEVAAFATQIAERRARGDLRKWLEDQLLGGPTSLRPRTLLELALDYRDGGDFLRSAVLLQAAHDADPDLTPVWQPLADALVASDDIAGAAALYERIADSDAFDDATRQWARGRTAALGADGDVVSGELGTIGPNLPTRQIRAMRDPDLDTIGVGEDTREIPVVVGSDRPTYELPAVPDAPDTADDSRITLDMPPPVELGDRRPSPSTDKLWAVADGAPPPASDNATRTTTPLRAQRPSEADIDLDDTIVTPRRKKRPTAPLGSAESRSTDRLPAQTEPARITSPMRTVEPRSTDRSIPVVTVLEPGERPRTPSSPTAGGNVPTTTLRGRGGSQPPGGIGAASELARAQELAARGQLSAAIARAENASAVAPPGDLSALVLLENLYRKSGDVDAQTEVIGRQIVATPDPAARGGLWRRRARLYRELPRRDAEVYRCLKEAHACAPDEAGVAHELRMMAMARGDWGLCAQLLYREIAAAPTDRERGALHLELGLVYDDRLGDPGQARANYEQALALDQTIPAATLRLARLYEAGGRFDDAARLFEDAARVAPADRQGLLRDRAAAARNRGPRDESLDPTVAQLERDMVAARSAGNDAATNAAAQRLWDHSPGHAGAFAILADRARGTGDLRALTALVAARAAALTDGRARAGLWFDLGQRWLDKGDMIEASRALDRALIDDADHAGALAARAELAWQSEDWPTADVLYAHLAPQHTRLGVDELLLRRSRVAEKLGRDRDALGLAQAAARLSPPRLDALLKVSQLAAALGEAGIATAAAQAALQLIPADDPERVTAGRLAIADLQRKGGDPAAALSQLESVLVDDPFNTVALDALVNLYLERNDHARAAHHLRALISRTERVDLRASRLFQLGTLYADHLRDLAAADDAFLRASDLDPGDVATMGRLLDTYWRSGDLDGMVEVASDLARNHALTVPDAPPTTLARVAVALAASAALHLARAVIKHLGTNAAPHIARALAELVVPRGDLDLMAAAGAIDDALARTNAPSLADVAAAADTFPEGAPVARALRAL